MLHTVSYLQGKPASRIGKREVLGVSDPASFEHATSTHQIGETQTLRLDISDGDLME